jgi:DNA-binding transcriptional regulator YiaG
MTYWTPEQFRDARRALGLTRVQLANELECGLRTVQRCETEGCRKIMALALLQLMSWR